MRLSGKEITSSKANIQVVLNTLGLTPDNENFTDTARRFLGYLVHYTQEYDPSADLQTTFPAKRTSIGIYDRALVVQVGIPYRAICAHHLLPVLGTAHVRYCPKDRAVVLSKLTRLVYGISHQIPSLQEDVCDEITDALMTHLEPVGAMCVITAEHGCMSARGVEEAPGCVTTVTSSIKGAFQQDFSAREEFYRLVDLG